MATFVRTQTIEHPIGAAGELSVSVTSADVSAAAAGEDLARVTATFEIRASSDAEADELFGQLRLRVSQGATSLDVKQPDDRHAFRRDGVGALPRLFGGVADTGLSIRVETPPGTELRLTTVSGDVEARGLVGTQRYETVSGDLSLDAAGGTLRINTVSGDTRVRSDASVAVRAESVSGDLALLAPHLVAVRATTVSGDVEIEGQLEPSGEFCSETVSGDLVVGLIGPASFTVRGISTDISSDIDHRLEGRHDRRRLVIGGGGPEFLFSSMSGDLLVRRPRRVGTDATAPTPPAPPAPPAPSAPPHPPLAPDAELAVLRALERGEIDVDEAARRLSGGSD